MKNLLSKFSIIVLPFILFCCQTKDAEQVKPNSKEELKVTVSGTSDTKSSSNSREEYYVQSYHVGTNLLITWSGSNWTSPNINIDLYKGSFAVTRIASNVPTVPTNYYTWIIPKLVQYGGGDFSVKITSTSNSANYSYSSLFNIDSGIVATNLAEVIISSSHPRIGRQYTITSNPKANLNYEVFASYIDQTTHLQTTPLSILINSDAKPLPNKNVPYIINSNTAPNSFILFQVTHNGVIVQTIPIKVYL